MSGDLLQESVQENAITSTPTDTIPSQPQKPSRKTWRTVGIVLGVMGLIVIACIAVFSFILYKANTEKVPVEKVLDMYMQHMDNKDAQSAYALFSPRAQRQVPISSVEELLEGNNYLVFAGYRSLSVASINITLATNSDPDVPQGTVAKVNGTVDFNGGFQGRFDGVLEQVGEQWMIDSIYVSVPPDKIK